ncbi:major capsid protein [Sporomusa sp.]|uniref:major capsid protein n=1 Tax=Sporomusa sp. TaxID=2078658 RepID=UPI002B9A4C73|nr:major capsid protein [Sporomusa sp.]HWR07758.1 major capsid protein [Sporomusa sp.]
MDINNTYALLQALAQAFPPQTLFRDTFFPDVKTFVTKTVLMDYKKGNRKMAPFVSKGSGGVNVGRSGFSTKEYEPPMMAPQRPTTNEDVENRAFGENVFSAITPEQRAQELRAQDMADLIDMNIRRVEWMCSQLMLHGQFEVAGYADDGETVIIDTVTYPDWTQKLTLTGPDMWTNPNADIYGVMEDMSQTVSRNSGRVPEVAIGSYKTCQKIIQNASILQYLMIPNAQNMSLMSFQPRIISPGVRRMGFIQSLNLEIFAYDGIYEDAAGNTPQYIPDGYFIMGVSGRGSQLFGAVNQLEQDGVRRTYQGANVPKVWNETGKDVQMIRVASKCVPKPEFIDDWYTLKAY